MRSFIVYFRHRECELDMINNLNYGKAQYNLKKIIDEKGISLRQIAKEINIPYNMIEKYYADNIQRIDLKIMTRLCFYLDVDYGDIFSYTPPVEKEAK